MFRDPSGTPPNPWASFCPNLSSRHPQPMTHPDTCTLITERPEKVHSTGSGPAWDSWGYRSVRSLNIWTSGAGGVPGILHADSLSARHGHCWSSCPPWVWTWLYSHFTDENTEAQRSQAPQDPGAVHVSSTIPS